MITLKTPTQIARKAVTDLVPPTAQKITGCTADEFFTRLRDGAQLAPDSPILRLRNVLDSAYANKRQRMSSSQVVGLTIKSWNAYRLGGAPMRSLSYRQGRASPERFPEPI